MDPKILIQEYETSRGFLRDLPDHELFTLVGRLATELLVRRSGDPKTPSDLHASIATGLAFGGAILEAHVAAPAGADPTRKN